MFDFLQKYPSDEITGAVYYALRVITEAKTMRPQGGNSIALMTDRPSDQELQLCNMILAEIQQMEKKEARTLPENVILKYTVRLSQILLETLKGRLDYDEDKADYLLRELRSAHPKL